MTSGRAFEVAEELAAPLVERGVATVEATADGFELVPANEEAARVEVVIDGDLITLMVGPSLNSHEILMDDKGRWEHELRTCLEAVVDGRYREEAKAGWISSSVLTMTFEMPGGRDVRVKHHDLSGSALEGLELPFERRFAPYE